MAFRGDLRSISLADIFQNIAANRLTGTLRIYNEQDERFIYFGEGEIRLYSPGKKQEDWIAELLVKKKKLNQEQKKTVLRAKKKTRKLLKHLLEELEMLSQEDFSTTLSQYVEEEIYDVFLWRNAYFEFQEGAPPPIFDREIQEANIQLDSYSVIMEAARRVDEWERMRQKIGSPDEVFLATPPKELSSLPPLAQDLLHLLDGTKRLEDILEDLPHSRFEIFQTVYELLEQGWIRPLEPEELFELAGKYLEEKKRAGAIRILRHLLKRQRYHPQARRLLAESLEAENRPLEAASEYKILAYQYLSQKEVEKAIHFYRRSVVLDPTDTDTQEKLLSIYLEQNRLDRAIPAGRALAATYLELGLPKQATKVYENLLQYENSPDLHLEAGKTYLAANENSKALQHFLEAGRLYLKANKEEEALRAFELAKELDPAPGSEASQMAEAIRTGRYHRRKERLKRIALLIPSVLLLTLFILAGVYEFLARRAWQKRLQQAIPLLMQEKLSSASHILYSQVIEYPLSLEAWEAKQLLHEITKAALKQAERLEEQGNFAKAYLLYVELSQLSFAPSPYLQIAKKRKREWKNRENTGNREKTPPQKAPSPKSASLDLPPLRAERKAIEEYFTALCELYNRGEKQKTKKGLEKLISFLEKQPPALQNVILEKAKYLLKTLEEE